VATSRTPQDHRPPAQLGSRSPAIIELGGEVDDSTIDVFTANGVVYAMPAEIRADLSLEALERMAENEFAATIWLLKKLFGREGYEALKRTATSPQLRAVTSVVTDHVLGQAEGN
jgi:hypothetical protein